jgi:hypothetical protein
MPQVAEVAALPEGQLLFSSQLKLVLLDELQQHAPVRVRLYNV